MGTLSSVSFSTFQWRGPCKSTSESGQQPRLAAALSTSNLEVVTFRKLNSPHHSALSNVQKNDRSHRFSGLIVPAVQGNETISAAEGSFNPQTIEEAINLAAGAVQRALADGHKRQRLQFLLPVDQRQFNYLDTEPRDYPCGIREEFAVCQKVVSSLYKVFRKKDLISRRIGETDNEMDPVGLIYPSDKSVAAIIFPIAETLKQIKSLASKDEDTPLLLVNPQWRSAGNIISDFGFGPWKKEKEDFVETFVNTYTLLEQRIGEASNITAGNGGVVRILNCYPDTWQVYLMASDGTSELIGEFADQPTYKELERGVAEARKRLPWKAPPRISGGTEPAPPPLPVSLSGFLPDEVIDEMEVTEVRRALMALGLPSSGRMAKLKDRLKEAQKKPQ